MTASAQQLFEASVDQVRRGQLRAALGTLLQSLTADPVHAGALEAASRICRLLGASDDAALFEAVAARPADAQALYALGYRMVDQGRPDVAAPLLQRALAAQPADVTIRRELAYARLQSGQFAASLAALVPLEDNPDLSETERLDVLLTLAEAALYAGDREACRQRLEHAEELVPEDDQRERLDALHGQLGRSARWKELSGLGLREWHFIQHAGVILKVAGGYFEDGTWLGRYDVLDLRLDMLAFLAQRLCDLLGTLELPTEVVVPASPLAAPLAWALAQRLGAELVEDLDGVDDRPALLVAASAAELAPLAPRLVPHTGDLRVFAVALDWERDAPVCPEVAGVLARRVLLPWEARYAIDTGSSRTRELPADERPPQELGAELLAAIEELPDDGGAARAEFEDFHRPLASALVLGNERVHPARRRFTALSPCGPAPVLWWTAHARDES